MFEPLLYANVRRLKQLIRPSSDKSAHQVYVRLNNQKVSLDYDTLLSAIIPSFLRSKQKTLSITSLLNRWNFEQSLSSIIPIVSSDKTENIIVG